MKSKTKLIITLFYLSLVGVFGAGFDSYFWIIGHQVAEGVYSDFENFKYAMEHSLSPYLLIFFLVCTLVTGIWLIIHLIKSNNKKEKFFY